MVWYMVMIILALIVSMLIYIYVRQGDHRRYDRRVFDRRVRSMHVPIERRINVQDRRQFNRRSAF